MTREIKPVIHLEQLEPRILLSGDSLLNIAPNPQQDTIDDNTSLTDQYAELLDTQEPVEEQISLEPAQSDTTNNDVYQPICTLFVDDDNTNDESVDADLSIDNIGPAQTGNVLAVLSNYFDANIESKVGTTEDGNMPTYINDADLSIEYATSIEIRGPPASDSLESDSISVTLEDVAFQAENTVLDEYTDVVQTQSVELPGLYLLDPDVGYFGGPVIYLDFDGAQDITYNGPVVVEGIDIPEFSADAAGLTGQEQQIISQILIELERTFQGSGVIFTSTKPDFGTEYSTILIGGDDSAFRAYGRFWGLSEKVDVGNQDPGDDALVFSEVIASCNLNKETFAESLADVIAHETAHLLGYSHDSSGSNGGILAPVAINVSVLAGEFLINRHTAGDQVNVSVDADSAGNYVAVWQGANIHGWGTNEIHLQRYNAEGTPMGQEQQVNPDWQGEQTNPDVAVADDGTFVVSWTTDNDGDSYGVNTRLFEADGTPVSGAFLVNTHTSDSQSDSEVAIDRTTGEFVVVWASSGQDGSGRGVYGQRFAADGTPVGDEFQVNTHTDNDQSNPMVAMDADGDFVVTWQSDGQDGSNWGVYGQRFAADGTPVGDEFQVNTYTSSEQRNAAIAMDEAGKFVIAWHSSNNQDGSSWGIYAQRYSTDGTPDGTEFLVNTYTSNTQAGPAIAMDTDGSHIIAWHSYTQDGSSYGIYAQGYASDGTALGGEFRANTYTSSDQQTPAVTVGANGDFLIAWQSRNQDGSVWGIYGQLYGTAGLAQADLLPVRVSALQGANFGQTIEVDANIRNQGGVDAGSFACRYYLSEDPTITTDDTPLGGQFSIADLGVMASMTDSRTLQIPGAQAPGTYYLGILLDLNDDVVEDNETNNGTATVGFALVNIAAAVPQLGGEFRVNRTRTTDDQHQVEMDADANGNFVVVWEGTNLNGYGTDDVFFQRYNALGTPLGGQIQIHPEWQGSQEDPDVAVAADGSFVVVYESSDGDQDGIYLRRFDATGTALGDPILVNTETVGWQGNPFVDVDDSGIFVVVWQSDGQDGSSHGVYGQRFDADGTPVGTEFQVNTYTASEQQTPAVAVGANGDFLIAWRSNGQDGSGYGVYAQRYNADGTVAGGEFLVNSYTTSNQQTPSVAIAAGGNFVVVWQSNGQDGSSWGVYGQRFHSDGSVNGGEFRINTHTSSGQSGADVVTHTDGSFLVVWHSYYQDGSGDGVYAQQFDPNGNLIGAEFRVNTYTNNEQSLPAVALGNGDRFLVGWRSQNQDGSGLGVYAQLFGTGLDQPDLVPLATHAPIGANQNAIITIDSEIRNQGTDISDSFAARYFISDDVTITTDDTPLGGPFTINGIGALTTINDSREVQLPPDAPIGMKYVGLLLDLYTAVTEQDETNNGTALVGFATMRIDPPATSLGGEFRINSSTDNDQTQIEVDSDVNGNYVAVWRGANRNGFAGNDIYMQRYNSLGTTLGSEIQVNPEWQGEQSSPDVAVVPDGSFVVTWHSDTGDDGDQTGIYARRFNADGQAAGDEFLVNTFTTNRQEGPAVAVDDNGNFVITWHSLEQDGSNWGVYAQRFDGTGNPVDTEFRVNSQSTNEQSSPEVAVDTDGDFVVVWQSWIQDGSEFGVYAQRYDSNGAPKGTEFQVNTYTSREQRDPSVAMDTAGNFTVLWESENQDGSSWAVMGQRFLADGSPSGGEFHVNPYTDFQANPSIGLAGDGSFVVAWDSNGQDGSGRGIYVQRYAADGSVIGGEFRANTYTSNDQTESGVAIGSGDRFLVAWSSHYQGDSDWGVYGQLYGAGVAKADLVPTAANATGGWNLSQAMQVNGVIRNQGLTDSGPFTAQYYLSQDATITTDDTPLGDAFNVADLAAMSTMTDSRWVAAPGVAAGDYYIGLIVDTGGAVDEQDETNNTYNPLFTDHTVNLQALPDLGTETRVNSQSPNEQSIPDVAVDTDGDFVVAWQSWNQDGSGWGVYGQRYDALGNTVGSEFRVNTTTSDDQHTPSVAMAPDGRFVVAWQSNNQDGGGWGVYAQQYGANGGKVGDEFLVNTRTTSTQDAPSLAMDTDGDFIVVWHDYGQDSSSNGGIYGQRFNADGTTNGSEFWVASSGGPNQQRPDVAMNATGQFVVAWDDGNTVWARAFDATATARSGEIEVHDFDSNQQYGSSVGIDAAGNFVVAWHSYGADNANWAIRARRFDTDGNPLGEEFTVNTYTADEQSWPALSMSTTGEFIITWHSSYQDGSNYGVYGQRFSADGSPYGGEFRVNTTTENDQSYPNVAMRTLDDFVVAWRGWDQATWSWDVFAKLAGVSNATSLPNLVVTQTDVPANINLNQTVEVTLTVENTGIAVAGPSTLRLWRSDDDVAGNEDDVDLGLDLAIPQILNGVGHNTFQTNASFLWPGNDPYGTDRNYFVLAAADAEDIVPEISEDDNTRTSNNMYLLMADLVMSMMPVPGQIQPGQDIDVELTVWNNGDATAESSIAHLWISDDNVPGNEDDVDLLLDIAVPELEPYDWPNYTQFQTTVSFAWPADDPFGTDRSYYVVGDLDVTDQVVESNEDNWLVSSSMWLAMPDLQVEVLNAPAEVRTGEAVSFDVRVRNYGDADASASTAHVWLSDDDIGGNGDEHDLFIDVPVPVLSPYSWPDYHEHIAPVTFTWPSPDPFGTDLQYHIAVMTDVLDVANESDETNNWALSEPIGLLVPDLTIQQTRTPSTVSAGMEVAARLQVANLGTEDIAEATVGHVWLSDNNVAGDLDDFDLGVDFEVPAINGQSAINILAAVPLPDADPFGTDGEYHLVFMVDSPNAIDEGRENNNVFVSDPFDWVIPLDLDIIPVGHLGGASFASATNGDYAYELTSAGLRVLNIADPGDMYKVGELLFDVEPEDPFDILQTAEVIVTDSIVTVMDVKTIRVIDVSSPTMPTQLWSSDFDGDNPDKAGIVFDASSGTPLVYIAEGDELNIADVTDPMVPTLVGQYPLPGQALGLALGDNVAYVLYYHPAFGGTALETIEIADPAAPDFLGRRLLTGEFGLPVVHNDLLAMVEFDTTGFGFDKVVLLDITDPVLPRARGEYMVPGEIMDLAFHGSDLVVSYEAWEGVDFDSHLLVLDVSDPFDPAAIAVLDLNLQTGPPEDGAGHLWIAGDTVYASEGEFVAVDLSDRFNPFVTGSFIEPFDLEHVAADGNRAAVLGNQLRTIDVSQPSILIPRGMVPVANGAQDLFLSGSRAVVQKYNSIDVYDLADSANPQWASSYTVNTGTIRDMVIEGDLAYLLIYIDYEMTAFEIIDISDLSTPVRLSEGLLPRNASSGSNDVIAVSGSHLYVTNAYVPRGGGQIVDEQESNDSFGTAMPLGAVPSVDEVQGELNASEYDYYSFTGTAGDRINIALMGAVAGVGDLQNGYLILYNNEQSFLTSSYYYTQGGDVFISNYTLPATTTYYVRVSRGYYAEGSTYRLALGIAGDVGIIDVGDPSHPMGLNNVRVNNPVRDMLANAAHLYLAVDSPPQLQIWDISDANDPVQLGTAQIAQPAELALGGNLIELVSGDGIQFVDVADPERPVTLETYHFQWPISDLAIDGGVIHVVSDTYYTLTAHPTGVAAPDLAATALAIPEAVQIGQPLDIDWTVRNHGQQTAPGGSWDDTVYLSDDARLDLGVDIELGFVRHTDPLDPLATYNASLPVPTDTLVPGSYFVIVHTDSGDEVDEFFVESNNVRVSNHPVELGYPDLAVTHVSGPWVIERGELLYVSWIVKNRGEAPADDPTWLDEVFLSITGVPDGSEISVGTVEHTDGLGVGEVYNASLSAEIFGVADGEYFIVVQTDSGLLVNEDGRETNNVRATGDPGLLGTPLLTIGVAMAGSLDANGAWRLYGVEVGNGDHLFVTLDDANNQGANELYIKYDAAPTRSDYDAAYTDRLAADQQVQIPDTVAGTYYILVYGGLVPAPPEDYSITASLLDFSIAGLSPIQGGNVGDVTLSIRGAEMSQDVLAVLVSPTGDRYYGGYPYWVDSSQFYATFDLAGADVGAYDVRLERPDGVFAEIPDIFQVRDGMGPDLQAELIMPGAIRAGRPYTIDIVYSNQGDTDMISPLLNLYGPPEQELGLEPDRVDAVGTLRFLGYSASGPAGILQPGDSGRITVYMSASNTTVSQNYRLTSQSVDPLNPSLDLIDWDALESQYRLPFDDGTQWRPVWETYTREVGWTWDEVIATLARRVTEMGRDGTPTILVDDLMAEQFHLAMERGGGLTDSEAPWIMARTVGGAGGLGVDYVEVTFSETINAETLTTEDVSITDPLGLTVGPVTITPISGRVYRIGFPTQTAAGVYDVLIGPHVEDLVGREMDQDFDGTPGEVRDDQFNAGFNIIAAQQQAVPQSGPILIAAEAEAEQQSSSIYIVDQKPSPLEENDEEDGVKQVVINFSHKVFWEKFPKSEVKLVVTPEEGDPREVPITGVSPLSSTQFLITFPLQKDKGTYTLEIGNVILGPNGYHDHDRDGKGGEPNEDVYKGTFKIVDKRGPQIKTHAPDEHVDGPIDEIDVFFNEPIKPDTFTRADVQIVDPADDPVAVVDVIPKSDTWFTITFAAQTTAGEYKLTIGPDIEDESDNQMDQDPDPEDETKDPYTGTFDILPTTMIIRGTVNLGGSAAHVRVQVWEENGGAQDAVPGADDDVLINEMQTTESGSFLFKTDLNFNPIINEDPVDGDGQRDLYFIVLAENRYGKVVRTASVTEAAGDPLAGWTTMTPNTVWAQIFSDKRATDDNVAGSRYAKDITVTTFPFALAQYVYTTGKWAQDETGDLPPGAVPIVYPYGAGASFHSTLGAGPNGIDMFGYIQIPGPAPKSLGRVAHEYGHFLHYGLVGGDLPGAGGNHQIYSMKDAAFALTEGWAEFVDAGASGNAATRYAPAGHDYETNNFWMGTGYNTGIRQILGGVASHGEIVEGGFTSILWDIYDPSNDDQVDDKMNILWTAFKAHNGETTVAVYNDLPTTDEYSTILIDHGVDIKDDKFDPTTGSQNDTKGNATDLGELRSPVKVIQLIMAEEGLGNGDWFKFTLPKTAEDDEKEEYGITVEISFEARYGDLDLSVWENNYNLHKWSVGRGTGTARVTFSGLRSDRDYEFDVFVGGRGTILTSSGNVRNGGGDYHPDYDLTINVDVPDPDDEEEDEAEEEVRVVRAMDPNDKVGPAGFGDANYIVPGLEMPFTIYYENDPDAGATVAAQIVRIEDPLDPDLDWSTFELGPMNLFEDFVVSVPAGLSYYETTVDLRPVGNNLLVHITAGLDAGTGMATWLFESLDPETLEPPDDAFAGFLPVNDKDLHNGEGHVSYTIRARSDLISGTEIDNQAFNFFDFNEAVPTPTTLHTIDAGLPTSSVGALPVQVPDEPLTVSWSGQDDENGSGIGSYTIYVSQDGGPWEIWLEDTPDTSAMFDGLGGHSYAFRSVATDNVGHVEDDPGEVEASTTFDFSQLRVDWLDVKPWGFTAYFKRPLDTSVLNLYDIEAGTYGPADMTVVGETVGPVAGSLIYDPEDKTISFIKTGGLLGPDTYTVTLRSGENGFKDSEGHLLDGDEDDVEGGDFVTTIVVESGTARLLSLPDFTRGPGQVVNVPAVGSGIPVTISDGSDILAVDFVLTYDPGLLNVTGLSLGSEIPDGWAPAFNLNTPGQVVVTIYGPTPLDAGEISLVEIEANVPEDAPYRSAAILGLSNIQVNEGAIASRADCAVQVAAYFGDATGNHTYSGLDAAYIARVAVGLDGGFSAYRLKDPVIVADVTGNGRLSGLDAAYFARKAVGLEQPQIPDLPDPIPGIIAVGRDPLLSIPENLAAQRGSMVTVPILVDDATDLFLADIDLRYDTNVFDLSDSGVSLGALTTGWNLISNVDDADGRVRLSAYSISALSSGFGSIVELEFNVRSDAVLGVTVIDLLESCSLNEGGLVLTLQDGEVGIQDAITIPTLLAWKLNDDTDVSLAGKLAYPVDREIAVLSNDSDGDIESRVSTTKKDDTPQLYVNYNEIGIEETTSIGVRGPHWAKLVLKTQYVSAQKAKDRKLIRLILDEYGEKAQLSITLNISRLYLVLRSS